MKFSVYFLILSTFIVFHLPIAECPLVLIGYALFAYIDRRIIRWRKNKLADEQLYWEKDTDDPRMENKGNLTRVRLKDDGQVIVHRIIDFLREM